jgi:hypothetical protein
MSVNKQASYDGYLIQGNDQINSSNHSTLPYPPPVSPITNSGHPSPSPHVSRASSSTKTLMYPLICFHNSNHRIQTQSTLSPKPLLLQANAVPPVTSSSQTAVSLSGQVRYPANLPVLFLPILPPILSNQTSRLSTPVTAQDTYGGSSGFTPIPALTYSKNGVQQPILKKFKPNEPQTVHTFSFNPSLDDQLDQPKKPTVRNTKRSKVNNFLARDKKLAKAQKM